MSAQIEHQRKYFAALLRDVADERRPVADALKELDGLRALPWKEEAFAGAFHALMHFQIDEDVRRSDQTYAAALQDGLRGWADKVDRHQGG